VWRAAVEEIWRRHGLGRVERIDTGFPGSNAVFLVNCALWVKIAWPFEHSGIEREIECYRVLEPCRDTLFSPQIVADGVLHDRADWPYFVMEHVPGQRLGDVWADVSQEDRLSVSKQLGRLIRALHSVPLDKLTTMDTSSESWAAFVQQRTANCSADLRQRHALPEYLVEQVPDFLSASGPLFPDDFAPALLHGDVTEDHILLSPVGGHWRITGFIDFGDALVGHSEYEFTCVHLGPFGRGEWLTRAFLESYGWDGWESARFVRRMLAYCLIHPWFGFEDYVEDLGGPAQVRSLDDLAVGLWSRD